MWADPVHGRCAGACVRGTWFVTPGPPLVLGSLSAPGTRASTPEGCVTSLLEASSASPRGCLWTTSLQLHPPTAEPGLRPRAGLPQLSLAFLAFPRPRQGAQAALGGSEPPPVCAALTLSAGTVPWPRAQLHRPPALLCSSREPWSGSSTARLTRSLCAHVNSNPAQLRADCAHGSPGGPRAHGSHRADHMTTDHTGQIM